jgi:hypothetical protein
VLIFFLLFDLFVFVSSSFAPALCAPGLWWRFYAP